MAKPSWLSINNLSGSGTGSIINNAEAHTGRLARTGIVTIYGEGMDDPQTYKVTQEAKPEFVSFDFGTEIYAQKKASRLNITGKSNSSRLTFSWLGETYNAVLSNTYSAGGLDTTNGAFIEGDPGTSTEYFFSLIIDLPTNDTNGEIFRALEVVADGGQYSYITIVQTNLDSYLYLSHTEVTIPQDGYPVSVSVTSNTIWTLHNGN